MSRPRQFDPHPLGPLSHTLVGGFFFSDRLKDRGHFPFLSQTLSKLFSRTLSYLSFPGDSQDCLRLVSQLTKIT